MVVPAGVIYLHGSASHAGGTEARVFYGVVGVMLVLQICLSSILLTPGSSIVDSAASCQESYTFA